MGFVSDKMIAPTIDTGNSNFTTYASQVSGMPAWAVATLIGTANQIVITPVGATLVFSTPQNIATTSSPTFAGLTLTGLTGLLKGASGVVGAIADGTANQILGRNNANNNYEYKTISGTANQVTVTHGANSIALALPQDVAAASSPTFANLNISAAINAGTTVYAGGGFVLAGGGVVLNYGATYDGGIYCGTSPGGAAVAIIAKLHTTTRTADLTLGGNLNDCGLVIDNTGAAGAVVVTLPPPSKGLHYALNVVVNQALSFDAPGTDVIRDAASVSSAGGTLVSSTVGDFARVYWNGAQWVVIEKRGAGWALT